MPLTRQEAFDKALAHLRQQGRPAMNVALCAYRSDDGGKCAIGALIPDDMYSMVMEGKPAHLLLEHCPELHTVLAPKDGSFYRAMQAAMHDNIPVNQHKDFREELEKGAAHIAFTYGLEYAAPQRPEGTV